MTPVDPTLSAAEASMADFHRRETAALAMGGEGKLLRRKAMGVLNARERIDYLCDPGSFIESGLFGTSASNPADREKTPADGKIAGFGRIRSRDAALVVNDFTVMGASSSSTNGRKIAHMKQVATRRGLPMVFLGESSGARMPDTMGSRGMGALLGNDGTQYQRTRESPWASATLGYSYGSSSWYAVLSDFCVIRKGAVLAVSSALLTSLAIKEEVDPEDLGGWRLHAETTGFADLVVDTDEQALAAVQRFLSYLPSHRNEAPPVHPVPAGSDDACQAMLDIVPESRNQVYDVRKVIKVIADTDSSFEVKERFGKSLCTMLARIDGRSVGFIASNPLFKGGALDADACQKVISFMVLCDSYNIPLVFLVDVPGFLIGVEGELRGMPGKVINWFSTILL